MPKTLEALLWCAALATWLMFLFALMRERLRPVERIVRRFVAEAFRVKPE